MRIDFYIDDSCIRSAVTQLIRLGIKPSLKNTRNLVKEMVMANGEQWITEPSFNDDSDFVVEFDEADKLANEIAPNFYERIY